MRRQFSDNLIVYFSREGENYWNGGIRQLEKGNTERVAEIIRESVGGTLLRIQTLKPYPEDYYECLEVAKKELLLDYLPPIEPIPCNPKKYDRVFLGFPIWWGQAPQCIASFLSSVSIEDICFFPFCTHEGSGLGASIQQLQKRHPEACFGAGLAIRGAEIERSKKLIETWATQNPYFSK